MDRDPVFALGGCRSSLPARSCAPVRKLPRPFRPLVLFAVCLAGAGLTGTTWRAFAGEAVDAPRPVAAQNAAQCGALPATGSGESCPVLDGKGALATTPETPNAIHDTIRGGEGVAEQNQQPEHLARDLELAHSEIDRLKAEAVRARTASEQSTNRISEELYRLREQTFQLQDELAEARRSIAAQNVRAERTAMERIGDKSERRLAENAAQAARDALTSERRRSASTEEQLTRARSDLKAAQATYDAVILAFQQALDSQRETTVSLARSLDAARQQNIRLKDQLRSVRAKQSSAQRDRTVTARQPKAGSSKAQSNKSGKDTRTEKATTIALPDSLLPTEGPLTVFRP